MTQKKSRNIKEKSCDYEQNMFATVPYPRESSFIRKGVNIMNRIYLASPYSNKDPKIRESRVEAVNKKAAELMEAGNLVFSPLSHSHPISKYTKIDPCDNEFWLRQDLWILQHCDEFHILCLDGWKKSDGVEDEWKKASEKGLKVVLHVT